jgi:hypothetical protein
MTEAPFVVREHSDGNDFRFPKPIKETFSGGRITLLKTLSDTVFRTGIENVIELYPSFSLALLIVDYSGFAAD